MVKEFKNLYEILGVPSNCSFSDLKKAYRDLAKLHHPDKGGDPNIMTQLTKAYDILSDPKKRRHYDQTSSEPSLNSKEEEIRNVILSGFMEAIQSQSQNCLKSCFNSIANRKLGFISQQTNMQKEIERLEKKKTQITKKAKRGKKSKPILKEQEGVEPNLFIMVIERHIQGLRESLVQCSEGIEILNLALEELENYESSELDLKDFGESKYNMRLEVFGIR